MKLFVSLFLSVIVVKTSGLDRVEGEYSNKNTNCTFSFVRLNSSLKVPIKSDEIIAESSHSCNTSSDCTPWSYCDDSEKCNCLNNNNQVFNCDFNETASILDCYCLTISPMKNTTEFGLCIYNCQSLQKINEFGLQTQYSPLPASALEMDEAMCGAFNRTGTLCGSCREGNYIRAYSYDMSCISCDPGWSDVIKFIAVAFIPLTLFYLLILYFQINISLSRVKGLIFFSQIVASPFIMRTYFINLAGQQSAYLLLIKIFGSFYGIWNLDFLRVLNFNICLSIEPLALLCLDYIVAVYPFILMVVTYAIAAAYDSRVKIVTVIVKPLTALFSLYKKNWKLRTSTIDVFSTFMILSSVKLACTCFDILIPVQVCETSSSNKCRLVLLYDATVPYFGEKHLPFAILAISMFLILAVIPVILLLFYQCQVCQKLLTVLLPRRWKLVLYTFLDSFQACYKTGKTGYQDYRWFTAMPFLVQFLLIGIYLSAILPSYLPLVTMVLTMYATIVILADPYKPKYKYISNNTVRPALFLASVAVSFSPSPYIQLFSLVTTTKIVLVFTLVLQAVYVTVISINWINRHRKFKLNLYYSRDQDK